MEDWVIYATISVFSWKLSIKLAETLKFHYRTPIMTLVLQKQKTISFFTAMKISLNIQTDNIVQRSFLNFQERRQQSFPTCAKPDNRKKGIEPFYGTTKRASWCSKTLRKGGKLFSSTGSFNGQGYWLWQHKLAQKVVNVLNWSNRKISLTLLRNNVDKQENKKVQVHIFAKTFGDEKFH